MDLYTITVSDKTIGITTFCESVDKRCRDYVLDRLEKCPWLKVTVTTENREEVKTA